jgi:tetratricopeptide (TPR) repeat protein
MGSGALPPGELPQLRIKETTMPLRRFQPALAAALLLVLGSPLWGQAWAGKGRLQGTVTDEQKRPVEGATITFRQGTDRVDAAKPGPAPIKTNKAGKWQILGLAGGAWGILIEKEGYMPSEGQVKVEESPIGVPQPTNVTLKLIPKEVQEQAAANDKRTIVLGAVQNGNALMGQQKYAEARAEYEKALAQVEPDLQPPILLGIAQAYTYEKQTDKAIETLKRSLAIKPDDAQTIQVLVNLLVAAGKEEEAQTWMAKLPQGTTVDPNALLNLGIKAYNEKKLDDAVKYFDRVVHENPSLPDAYYYRGLVYLNQSKTAEAKADFQKVLELDPKYPKADEVKEFLKAL